jgi:hypothetical protein
MCQSGVSDLTETRPAKIRSAMSGKGVMARKTSVPERVGSREPSAAVMSAAEMGVAEAVATTEMAAMTTTMMTSTVATAVTTSMTTAAFADRRARQQGRQSNDHNSDGPFGHGTSLRATHAAALERRPKEAKVPLAPPHPTQAEQHAGTAMA